MASGHHLPNDQEFREWLIQALSIVNLSHNRVGCLASERRGVSRAGGKNQTVSRYLNEEQSSITISVARSIYEVLHETAKEKNLVLPPISVAEREAE